MKQRSVIPFPETRRKRQRLGGALADARAEALKARFRKVSKGAQTGDDTTLLKRLLKRY